MELTYTNANGESVTLRQTRPFFLTRVDGAGKVRQTVNTFKAPDQDGAFFISSAMDMRNITLEGSVITPTVTEASGWGSLWLLWRAASSYAGREEKAVLL